MFNDELNIYEGLGYYSVKTSSNNNELATGYYVPLAIFFFLCIVKKKSECFFSHTCIIWENTNETKTDVGFVKGE